MFRRMSSSNALRLSGNGGHAQQPLWPAPAEAQHAWLVPAGGAATAAAAAAAAASSGVFDAEHFHPSQSLGPWPLAPDYAMARPHLHGDLNAGAAAAGVKSAQRSSEASSARLSLEATSTRLGGSGRARQRTGNHGSANELTGTVTTDSIADFSGGINHWDPFFREVSGDVTAPDSFDGASASLTSHLAAAQRSFGDDRRAAAALGNAGPLWGGGGAGAAHRSPAGNAVAERPAGGARAMSWSGGEHSGLGNPGRHR
jgi:hypothetical protein